MFQCLKLLVLYVPKYHWGIQTICNVLLQLDKEKQGSAVSGAAEKECSNFISESPSKNPFK